ncbi:MAG: TRAP transporter large permease subunit, partial [Thermohalobaculum sp.]|nr:TRAP transporter large permease subunit [Thermohalobaculum sp.]
MGLVVLFGVFFAAMVAGVPVAFALGLATVAGFVYEGLPLFVAFQRILAGVSVFSLLAIPFFIFAGDLMLQGGIAARIVRLAAAAVGS